MFTMIIGCDSFKPLFDITILVLEAVKQTFAIKKLLEEFNRIGKTGFFLNSPNYPWAKINEYKKMN